MEFLTWLQEQCYQTFIEDDRWRIYFLKGLGTTFKITIGALILGFLNNGLNLLGVSSYYQMIVKAVVILLAVLVDNKKQ